ncbi:MAG: 2-oxoglutarate dehydrogenase, E2 component, dihydrolipoamide succinyltransferase [Streptosporangiales bacterium]|nr:2-oxoglutarate dehydrogenase, E2 component, dihydrolipoamide succinyltransferase [Streptosporangiales bacterium]
MSVSVTMPQLGESVTEGTVTRWLKQEGEQVQADEPLLEVSTDKVDTEIPAPTSGTLLQIKVGEDETVQVGAELATIGEASESGGGAPQSDGQAQAPQQQAPPPQQEEPAPQQPAEPAAQEPQQSAPPQQSGGGGGSAAGTPVTMPQLGESVTEGTVTRWLKQEGDQVQADEPLLEVSTDKVDTEIPAPTSGTLLQIKVGEDETVQVGAELATIGDAGAQASAPAPQHAAPQQQQQEPPAPAAPAQQAPTPPEPQAPPRQQAPPPPPAAPTPQATPAPPAAPAPQQGPGGGEGPYLTPLVRKLAAEHGVDVSALQGSGVGGRIRKQDVLDAAKRQQSAPRQQAPAAPAAGAPAHAAPSEAADRLRGTTEKMSRLRSILAKRMVESLQIAAQLTTVVEADVTKIARLRNRAKADFQAREGVKLSFMPFFALATVEALKQHPKLNASIDADTNEVTYYDAEHLGIAIDTERGLVAAVAHHAGDLNLAGLARKITDLAERTRANKVSPDELGGATFTLSNTGSRGALFDTPIIVQPQMGILGTGTVVKRAVVIDDEDLGETIAVRHMVYLALTYDHRLVDGADAARFLTTIKERLEEGNFEADLGLD